jgi:hypothetical protein
MRGVIASANPWTAERVGSPLRTSVKAQPLEYGEGLTFLTIAADASAIKRARQALQVVRGPVIQHDDDKGYDKRNEEQYCNVDWSNGWVH